MKARYWTPLASFLLPTIIISYGLVFPRNHVASFNELTFGFAVTLFLASLTYVLGIRKVMKDQKVQNGQ